ncbi:MAG TPA: hypothetical protein VFG04_29595 [Planctomycetaceae bacterium]|jgi:hypothetical protein|nr:hypothetical protein [Planctomycetaceae bacterium]
MPRILGTSLLVIVSLVVTIATCTADSASTAQTVFLKVSEPEGYHPDDTTMPFAAPLLDRELVRQALLLAARDELGLSTRDVLLREEFPEKPDAKSTPLILQCQEMKGENDYVVQYLLYRGQEAKESVLWRWVFTEYNGTAHALTSLTRECEALSRGDLKDLLKRAGSGRPLPVARPSADVPSATQDLFWAWNEISVVAGLRRVHADIRDKGEAPELLAALAIGYANLGALTDYYSGAHSKAFQARALLYAERLVRKTQESPWALWHRAYVRTLVGLHNFAADDVAAAKKKQGQIAPAKPLPFWTGVIEAFGQGELSRMLKEASTPPQRRLARFLNIQALRFGTLNDLTIKAAREFLKDCPDCWSVADLLFGEVGGWEVPLQAYASATDRRRLLDVLGLPEAWVKRISKGEENEDNTTAAELRKELIADLKRAGAPELDRGEPSLSAVGHILEEIDFAQALRQIQNVSRDLEFYRSLCAAHPYAAYIDAFTYNRQQMQPAAATLEKHVELFATTFRDRPLLQWIYGMNSTPQLHGWYQACTLHADMVFPDEMRKINLGFAGEPDAAGFSREFMREVWATSNKLPQSVALRILRDWESARTEVESDEHKYSTDPLVMRALAVRYCGLKKYDAAERCSKHEVETAPSFAGYQFLASVYKAKKDRGQWKATLDKALGLPGDPLEHAAIRNEIALDLLDHLQYRDAVVYADSAAETGAEWALMTDARCHEMLEEWTKSEQLVRAASERYPGSMFAWMHWCHRTGRGNVHAADELTRQQLEAWGTTLFAGQQRQIGLYYQLTGERENSLLLLQKAYEQKHEYFAGLQAALVADTLGKTTVRDALLQEIIKTDLPHNFIEAQGKTSYQQLAGRFQSALPPKNGKLEPADLEKIIADSRGTFKPATIPFYLGLFFKNRGDLENAKKYLLRSAEGNDWDAVNHVLACQLLRELKVKVPPPKAAPTL